MPGFDFSDEAKLLIASAGALLAGASSFLTSIGHIFSAGFQCYGMLQGPVFDMVAGEEGLRGSRSRSSLIMIARS